MTLAGVLRPEMPGRKSIYKILKYTETPGRLKRAVKRNMQAWFTDFCRLRQEQSRLNAKNLPLEAFFKHLKWNLAQMHPGTNLRDAPYGFWKLACSLPAHMVWKILRKAASRIFPTQVIADLHLQANDNRSVAPNLEAPPLAPGQTWKPPSLRRKDAAKAARPKVIFGKLRKDTPAKRREAYIRLWHSLLDQREAQHKQVPQPARRKPKDNPSKRREAYIRLWHGLLDQLEAQEAHRQMVATFEKGWFKSTKPVYQARRQKFLARPGVQEAYNAYLSQTATLDDLRRAA